jgi:hypothetical protein
MVKPQNPKSAQRFPARIHVLSAKAKAAKDIPAAMPSGGKKPTKKTKSHNKDTRGDDEEEVVEGPDEEPKDDDPDKVEYVQVIFVLLVVAVFDGVNQLEECQFELGPYHHHRRRYCHQKRVIPFSLARISLLCREEASPRLTISGCLLRRFLAIMRSMATYFHKRYYLQQSQHGH